MRDMIQKSLERIRELETILSHRVRYVFSRTQAMQGAQPGASRNIAPQQPRQQQPRQPRQQQPRQPMQPMQQPGQQQRPGAATMTAHRVTAVQPVSQPQRKRSAPSTSIIKVPRQERPTMLFEHKRAMAVAFANLSIERQARVYQYVQDSAAVGADGEGELDLDELDNETLWRLFDYVFPRSKQIEMRVEQSYVDKQACVGASLPETARVVSNSGSKPTHRPAAVSEPANPTLTCSETDSSDSDSSDSEDVNPNVARKAPSSAPARKEMHIQNQKTWENFAAQASKSDGAACTTGNAPSIPDALWDEFARREAEKAAREKERVEAEARDRENEAKERAERDTAAAKAKAEAEAEAKAAEEKRREEREAARERARAELEFPQTVNLDEQRVFMETEMGGLDGGFILPAFPGMDNLPPLPSTAP
jgi:hypothetical protein